MYFNELVLPHPNLFSGALSIRNMYCHRSLIVLHLLQFTITFSCESFNVPFWHIVCHIVMTSKENYQRIIPGNCDVSSIDGASIPISSILSTRLSRILKLHHTTALLMSVLDRYLSCGVRTVSLCKIALV